MRVQRTVSNSFVKPAARRQQHVAAGLREVGDLLQQRVARDVERRHDEHVVAA